MKIENREQLQTKIAHCLRDNGCSSDGAPNRYFAAGKVLDLIEQSPAAQVEEKEWEVLSYKHRPVSEAISRDVCITSESKYWQDAQQNKDEEYSIHSIRIKKTGDVFSVGDKIKQKGCEGISVIKAFKISDQYRGDMAVEVERGGSYSVLDIDHCQEPVQEKAEGIVIGKGYRIQSTKELCDSYIQWLIDKGYLQGVRGNSEELWKEFVQTPAPAVLPVLLTTTDGKDITDENQRVYGVDMRTWLTAKEKVSYVSLLSKERKWFSTEEDRQEYIEYEKPCLSQREVNELMSSVQEIKAGDYQEKLKCALDSYVIEKLAKTKLNG